MIKKFIISLLFILLFSSMVFAAPMPVSNCPGTSIQNDTEYILRENFNVNANPCFDLSQGSFSNIVINGNGTPITVSALTYLVRAGIMTAVDDYTSIDDLTIKNVNAYGNLTLLIIDSNFDDPISNIYILNNSVINHLEGDGFIKLWANGNAGGDSTSITRYLDGQFEILNNYYLGRYGFIMADSCRVGVGGCLTHFENFIVQDNDILHRGQVSFGTEGSFWSRGQNANTYDWYIDGQFIFEYNNIVGDKIFAREPTINGSQLNGFSNNFDGGIPGGSDLDGDGLTDSNIVRTSLNSIIYSNAQELTFSPSRSGLKRYEEEVYMSQAIVNPNTYNDYGFSPHVILSQALTLDSSNYFNFQAVQGAVLDLELHYGSSRSPFLTITSPRGLRMGNGNSIIGREVIGVKPIIITSGLNLNIADAGYFTNDWQLIDYVNELTIQGINFDMNANGNYGLVRKFDTNSDGINFRFYDNEFDLNYVPTSPEDRPQFVVGAFADIQRNTFDLGSSTNVSLLGWGISGSTSGGHNIVENSFIGGGIIFAKLSDVFSSPSTNIESIFINNEFRQSGTFYASPFFLPFDQRAKNLIQGPKLNSTYYYKTTCTNYEFNIGNYYEDWDDQGFYNDSNGDDIHDSYLGIDYITRGFDYTGDAINDYKSPVTYPYDFASNTAGKPTTDTCITFNFNIVSPTAQNYSSGTQILSNWEFISSGLTDMYCFENFNGEITVFTEVDSGDNKGVQYENTDGTGMFNVKCCDNLNCNNLVEESETVYFCVGDCDVGLIDVIDTEIPTTPGDDDGDDDEDDENGFSDLEDGISFNIFSSDLDESSQGVGNLFALAETPLGYLALLGFVMLFAAIVFLTLAIMIAFVRKK